MCASTLRTAAPLMSGPCTTPASVPGPTFSFATAAVSFSANAS